MADAGTIKLLCLDLIGTSLDSDGQHCWFADELVELLNVLGERGVQWCTNSGRSHHNQLGLVQACRPLRHMPTALLAGERFIYWLKPRFASHEPFNSEMAERMAELFPRVQQVVEPHRERLRRMFSFNFESDEGLVPGWNLDDDAQVPALVAELEEILRGVADAQILCNGSWVVITHAMAGKGVVLAETARYLGIRRENILAIGDHLNDVDMLDGRVAGYVGCPADADPKVRQAVESAGGIVSDREQTAGTVAIIRQHFDLW